MKQNGKLSLLIKSGWLLLLLLGGKTVLAHNVNVAMDRGPAGEVFWFYFKLGVEHILPYGIDHVLFIVALCLLNTKLKTILL